MMRRDQGAGGEWGVRVGKAPGGRGCPAGILEMRRSIPGRCRWRNFQVEGRVTCRARRQETDGP